MALRVLVAFDRDAFEVVARHRPDHPGLARRADFEASIDAHEVAEALGGLGHSAQLLPLGRDAVAQLAALDQARPDLVFNLCDTLCADGAKALLVPAALETMGIAYTGANAAGLALSKRKQDVKNTLARAHLPTPRYQVVSSPVELAQLELGLEPPVIVKPTAEHASIGIDVGSICFSVEEVRARAALLFSRLGGAVLVEEYVAGREVYVSLLADPARPLTLMEHGFEHLEPGFPRVRSFDLKWFSSVEPGALVDARWAEDVPARRPAVPFAGSIHDVQALCAQAFQLAGGRDWGRVDVRVDARSQLPFIIDVTPNTYLGRGSPCAKAAAASGVEYPAFVESIALSAVARASR